MSRLETIRKNIEATLEKVESPRKPKAVILNDMSDLISCALEHRGLTFTGSNWGQVLKLAVIDDMLMDLKGENNGR